MASGARPSGAASSVSATGPRPSSRPRRISTSASSSDQCRSACGAGAAIGGSSRASGHSARNCGSRSAATHSPAFQRLPALSPAFAGEDAGGRGYKSCRAPLPRQLLQPFAPALAGGGFGLGQKSEPGQPVMQFVAVRRVGPGLLAHPRDRVGVEPPDFGGVLRGQPAAAHHRLRAALLERRVVEIGVGLRRQHFERQRRRLGQIARDDLDLAGPDARQQTLQPGDVHDLVRGSRRSSGGPADGPGSRAARRGFRRRRAGPGRSP